LINTEQFETDVKLYRYRKVIIFKMYIVISHKCTRESLSATKSTFVIDACVQVICLIADFTLQ